MSHLSIPAGPACRLLCLLVPLALLTAPAARADGDALGACVRSEAAPAEVLTLCSKALEDASLPADRRAAGLTRRALAWMAQGGLDGARADLDDALRLDPHSAWAWNSSAVVWMQRGEVARAIADYEQAVGVSPDYGFAWTNLANARLIHGEVDQALADFSRSIALAPAHLEIALTGRAKAWLAKGDYAHARADFEAALQANPAYANALSGRAFTAFCEGNFDAAVSDFRHERALRKDAESALDLSIALRRAGHDATAELATLAQEADHGQGLPPGLALLQGTLSPEQALKAGADRDPRVARQRACSTSFAAGEWYLLQGDSAKARQYFEVTRQTCDPSQGGHAAAGAELSRLDASK